MGPSAKTRCAGEASVAVGLRGYYEFAGADRIGAAKPGEYVEATAEIMVGSPRSDCPPRGFRWIGERQVGWTDTADCHDCRLVLAADYSIEMRSSSYAMHEAAG